MTYSVFHERVLQNREVCSYCFRRIRGIEPAPDDDYWTEHGVRTNNGHSTPTLRDITTPKTTTTTDNSRFCWTEPVVHPQAQRPVRRGGGRVVCDCGRIDGGFGDGAKPKDELRSDLARACDRVREADEAIDVDAAFDYFEEVASDPDRQHDQLGILAEAVQVGCLVADAHARADSDSTTEQAAADAKPTETESPA